MTCGSAAYDHQTLALVNREIERRKNEPRRVDGLADVLTRFPDDDDLDADELEGFRVEEEEE